MLILSVFIVCLFLFTDKDEIGSQLGLIFLICTSIMSFVYFGRARRSTESNRVYSPDVNTSTIEQIAYYKRMVRIGIVAFLILTCMTIYDLNQVQSGEVEHLRTWMPVSFLYNLGGYWLAIMTTPLIGLITLYLLIRKIKQLKAKQ